MPAQNILIFTAVQMETRSLQKALRGSACRVQTVGIGARHLPAASEMAGIEVILMCGVAGGLDPALRVGDVVVDDPQQLLPKAMNCRFGQIHSTDSIISSPDQKSDLFRQTDAIAVDMEQAIVAKYAKKLQIPLIGIRAISDSAAEVLDPAVVGFVNDLGEPRAAKIATTLLRRPNLIPYLRKLGKNTNIALAELGKTVTAIVKQLEGY